MNEPKSSNQEDLINVGGVGVICVEADHFLEKWISHHFSHLWRNHQEHQSINYKDNCDPWIMFIGYCISVGILAVQLRMSDQNAGAVCASNDDHRKECVWMALCPDSSSPVASSQLPEPLPNIGKGSVKIFWTRPELHHVLPCDIAHSPRSAV